MAMAKGKRLRPDITKEMLEELYCNQSLSLRMVRDIVKVSEGTLRRYLQSFGIHVRNRSEGTKLGFQKGRIKVWSGLKGKKSFGWKGGRCKTALGYVLVYAPEHPRARSAGGTRPYVLEHILVWEQANGRQLPENHIIHHLNGIKDDNRPNNLVAISRSAHRTNTRLALKEKRIRELEAQLAQKEFSLCS